MELTMNFSKIDLIHLYHSRVTLLHVYAQECETKIYVEVSVEKNNRNQSMISAYRTDLYIPSSPLKPNNYLGTF